MSVHISVPQFEGPFDLLLSLVEKAKMDIRDIAISQITDQYMEALGSGEGINMENMSSFLRIAATLLYIKSRMLLPSRKELEEEEDEEALLVRQLQEYKRYKEATQLLRDLESRAEGAYVKLPEEVALEPEGITIDNCDVDRLYALFVQALGRKKPEIIPITEHRVQAEHYSVAQRAQALMRTLQNKKRIRFDEYISKAENRLDAVSIFLAVLELLSLGNIHVRQSRPYEHMYIQLNEKTPYDGTLLM